MTTLALVLANIIGAAPFCSYDGFNYHCFYYSWSDCEQAIRYNPQARCVVKP